MNLAPIAAIPDAPLRGALALVDRHFDADAILDRAIGLAEVAEYYRQSDPGYRLMHSREGALHIALGCDGRSDTSGYPRQAELFRAHLDALGAERALEFGSGMGYNTRWLAEQCPERRFLGVDLTASHVAFATKRAAGLENARFEVGNYEELSHADGAFDAVLAVETLCQTTRLERALGEARRVLRPGGRLVVIDCFRRRPLETHDADLQRAARLVEKTTAVAGFTVVDDWIGLAEAAGLRLVEARDLSAETEQNLARLYKLARRFFRMPALARGLGRAARPLLMENAVCGLLMPYTVGGGAHTYQIIVVEK